MGSCTWRTFRLRRLLSPAVKKAALRPPAAHAPTVRLVDHLYPAAALSFARRPNGPIAPDAVQLGLALDVW
jgi:hypothetical protein